MTESIEAGQANDAAVTGQQPAAPVETTTLGTPAAPAPVAEMPAGPDWLTGASEDTMALAIGKGWKDAGAVVESYRNLERFSKGAKDVVGIPDFDNAEAAGAFYNKLGRPEAVDGYDFTEVNNPGPALDWFKEAAHGAGLTQRQALALSKGFSEYETNQNTQTTETQAADYTKGVDVLRKEFGAGFDKQVELSKRGWAGQGVDSESMTFLEQKLGVEAAVHLGIALAQGKGEDTFIGTEGSSGGFGAMTPVQARQKIGELMADTQFLDVYQKQKGPAHTAAVEKMRQLHSYAAA